MYHETTLTHRFQNHRRVKQNSTQMILFPTSKRPFKDGAVMSLFFYSDKFVGANPVGCLLCILVKEHLVIYFYIGKIIINMSTAANIQTSLAKEVYH